MLSERQARFHQVESLWVMNKFTLFPFDHFMHDDEHFCPKCGDIQRDFRRSICNGIKPWFGESKCPELEHFHHKCVRCNGEWCESTYHMLPNEVKIMIAETFNFAEKAGLTEEDIVNIWRIRLIKQTMSD